MKSILNFSLKKRFSTGGIRRLKNFINGEFVDSKSKKLFDIINPSTGEVISQVPDSMTEEFNTAVDSAKTAFKTWKDVPLLTRQRYIIDYVRILKDNHVTDNFNKVGKTSTMHQ